MYINFYALQSEFKEYLEKNNLIRPEDAENGQINDISIFAYANEFKEYLEDEANIDNSELSASIEDIMQLGVDVGQIQPESEQVDVQEKDVETQQEDQDSGNILNDLFNNLLGDKNFFAQVDKDNDNKISNEEKENFLNLIKNFDGNNDDISAEDILSAADYIKNGEYEEKEKEINNDNIKTPEIKSDDSESSNNTASNTNSGNYGVGGNYNGGNVDSNQEMQKSLDGMSKSELNSELISAKDTLSQKEAKLEEAKSGAPLSDLNNQVEEAYNNYYNQVNNVEPSMAEELHNVKTELENKKNKKDELKNSLADINNNIKDMEAQYQQQQNTISALSANLASLNLQDCSNLTPEQKTELEGKIRETQSEHDYAVGQAEELEQKIREQKTEKENTEKDKKDAENAYNAKLKEKTELESKIREKHPEINELMNEYNMLKTQYDVKKDDMVTQAQIAVNDAKNRVNEVQTALGKADDKSNIKQNLSFSTNPDLFDSDISITSEYVERQDNNTLSYLLIGPENVNPNEELPVLVYLHGMGEVGQGENSLRSVGPGKFVPQWSEMGLENFNGYIICPMLPGGGWDNANIAQKIDNIMSDFKLTHNINENKVAIAGHSLGSKGALYVGTKSQTQYCSIALLSGYKTNSVNVNEATVPVYGYVGSSGEDSSSYNYMMNEFANTVGAENVRVYPVNHGGVPGAVLTEDLDGDNRSDFFTLLFSDKIE